MRKLRAEMRLALRFAQQQRPITFDDAARERWIEIYQQLSSARPGLAGAATARAEAHTARLALIYALLDLSERICLEHLEAALAVWRYSAASAAGSSATRSATPQPTRSGRPPRNDPAV